MSRDAEKLLMKELEKLLSDRDQAEAKQAETFKKYEDARKQAEAARTKAAEVSHAISSLRGDLYASKRDDIEQEARQNIAKEKPVA